MSVRSLVSVSICLMGLILIIPAVSAGGISESGNQTHLTEFRDRVVNTSHVTSVMMQGAVQYIDQISNSSGSAAMTATREHYNSAAAGVPSIQNVTELRTSERDLREIEHLFFNQTQTAVKTYNGTQSALHQSINASLSAAGLNEPGNGPRPGHGPGLAGNETAPPDFCGNETAGHGHGFAGNETAPPDFCGNETAGSGDAPGHVINGTATGDGNITMLGNGSAGRANLKKMASVS